MRKQIQEKCVGGSSGCNSVRKRSPATQRGRRLPIGRLDCGWSEQRSDWSVGGNKGAATATTTPQGNKVWGCQSLHWGHRTSSSSSSYIVTISITLAIRIFLIIITANIMLPISHYYVLFVGVCRQTNIVINGPIHILAGEKNGLNQAATNLSHRFRTGAQLKNLSEIFGGR